MKYEPLTNLVYILQSEHYDAGRFLKFVYNFRNWQWWNLQKRGELVWTKRVKEIYFLAWILLVIDWSFGWYFCGWWFLLGIFILPFYVAVAHWLVRPYIEYKKNQIKNKARDILKKVQIGEKEEEQEKKKGIEIIGISGSFGKTTAKNILTTILSEQFKVLKTPGNINTDMGVAKFLIEKEQELDNYDFLILEMSAYRRGDIAEVCRIAPPEYSLTTAIGLVHLERFGSLENIKKAKAELGENTLKTAYHFSQYQNKAEKINFLDDFQGVSFELTGKKFQTKLLAEHNLPLIAMAVDLARELGESWENIEKGIQNIEQIKHRLEIIRNEQTGVTVIDDSYNGNYDGFISGIKVLARTKGRKVVLTPGIVELGKKSEEIHQKIAEKYLEHKIDLILLIDNQNTQTIKKVLEKNNFTNFKIYPNAQTTHQDLAKILKSGDTILFQNDLSDNY